MSYIVERFINDPIIVFAIPEDYNMQTEMADSDQAVANLLDRAGEPTFVIYDIRANLDFGKYLMDINSTGTNDHPVLNHPNLWEPITISEARLGNKVLPGMVHKFFDNAKNPVFPTFEDALNYIRSQYQMAGVHSGA